MKNRMRGSLAKDGQSTGGLFNRVSEEEEKTIMDMNQSTGSNTGVASAPPEEQWSQEEQGTRRNIARKTKETASHLKQEARKAGQDLRRKGTEKAHQLQEQGGAFLEGRKSEVADRISGCGAAVRRAAEKLRDEEDPNIARYAEMVADRFEQAGNYVATRDVKGMYRDLENAARRRPEILFGGMFVAGLVLARFLKASESRNDFEVEGEENYWVEEGYDEGMTTETQFQSGVSSTPRSEPVGGPATSPMSAPAAGSGPNNPGWSPQ